jgi:signal transduction histidine kinase
LPSSFASPSGASFLNVALPDGREGRAVALRFVARDETSAHAKPLLLVLAEGTGPVDHALANLRTVFIVVVLAALVIAALLASWLLARVTRPLSRLGSQIEQIDDRLSTRVVLQGLPIELDVVVRKLNQLLARLEASMHRERELTADVSHELRTPLAALRTLLEVTALGDRDTAEYKTANKEALAVVNQLGDLVENLMTLSRLEGGQMRVTSDEFDIAALVTECWTVHAPLAVARGIEFRNKVLDNTTVRSDQEKLRIVIGNLLANAAEYTESGGWIEITNESCLLAVTDSGPPLSAQDRERVFDRFWRHDQARSGSGAHCGIGLSLSRSLCEHLCLTLVAETDAEGHVTFRIGKDPRA